MELASAVPAKDEPHKKTLASACIAAIDSVSLTIYRITLHDLFVDPLSYVAQSI